MSSRAGLKLFRAGSYVLIALALVHSISLFSEPLATNATEKEMFRLMKTYQSDVMGSRRTMWQFYYGFSVSFTVLMLAMGGLNLMVSRVVDWHVLRSLAFFNACSLTAMTLVSIVYFFIAPTVFLGTADVLFVLAWWKAGRT